MTKRQAEDDVGMWRCFWCGYPVPLHMLDEDVTEVGVPNIRFDVERFQLEVAIHQRYCSEAPDVYGEGDDSAAGFDGFTR